MAHDVFLAYPSAARALAEPLYDALVARDLSVCMDVHSLPAGQAWDVWLPAALSASRLVVALITPDYERAFFLRSEVNRAIAAFRAGRQGLLPVYAGGAHPGAAPYGLDLLQSLVLEQHGQTEVVRVVAEMLASGAGVAAAPPPPPTTAAPPPKRGGAPWLLPGEVDEIVDVALASRALLFNSRDALLIGLAPEVQAALPITARTAGERLLADVATLNGLDTGPGETAPPLARWLDAALRATRVHARDAAVFRRYRQLLP
jgi:hypothetical protein